MFNEETGREMIDANVPSPIKRGRGRPPTGKEPIKPALLALDAELMKRFHFAKDRESLRLGFKLTNKQFFTVILSAFWNGKEDL
tara:strand:- start:719 stop:970 length:252 start_codon:yes stop_codon:yes gene_type:complete